MRSENSMKNYGSLLITAMVIMLLFYGTGYAQDAAEVDLQTDGISITQLPVPHFWYMKLRIADPDGKLICNRLTEDENLDWVLPAEAIDGIYRYEVVILTYDPALDSGNEDGPTGEGLLREHGSFRVEGAMIIVPEKQPLAGENQSLWQGVKKTFCQVMKGLGDFLVPAAEAADLTAESPTPHINFDDTEDEDYTPTFDWQIVAEGGDNNADTNNTFKIKGFTESDGASSVTILELRHDGGTGSYSSENSMVVDYNGDIDFADGKLFIDRMSGHIGIGKTSNLGKELTVASLYPQICFFDETDDTKMNLQYNSGFMAIEGDNGEQDIVKIYAQAPEAVMTIGNNGYTTFYRNWSHASADGLTSLVALKAHNTADPATYCSDVGFALINDRENFIWNFRTAEDYETGFMITKAGTGGAELLLENNSSDHKQVVLALGNGAWCDGTWHNSCSRTLKKDIKPLDAKAALQAFEKLEPVTYVYKAQPDDPKVGFIAEDLPDLVADPQKKSVSSIDVVALLTKVLKEQQREIDSLKADNQALRTELQQKMALLERQLKALTSLASAK